MNLENFDLKQYMGKWYEIAAIPQRYEAGCRNVTATYKKRLQYVEVKNSCTKNGKQKTTIGKAFLTDEPNVFKVQFFWPFKGEYRIVYIDLQYQNVIVASGSKALWILSRNPIMDDETFKQLKVIAQKKGYKTGRMVKTIWGSS